MDKDILHFIRSILIFILLVLTGLIYYSPYSAQANNRKAIVNEIVIDSSVDSLFDYLGDSKNAKDWSVFVSRIESLNACDFLDGEVGSVRRCFGKEPEVRWDEEILEVIGCKRRVLSVLNGKGFPIFVSGLRTEQRYIKLGKNKTLL